MSKRMNNHKIRGKPLMILLLICSLLMSVFTYTKAYAAEAQQCEVKISYQQTLTVSPPEAKADQTYYYRIAPKSDFSPLPVECKSTGCYQFSATGTSAGSIKLHIPVTSPGYYEYEVTPYVEHRKLGYTYETDVYTVTVMVVNSSAGGFRVGSVTIQDEALEKYTYIPLRVDYKGDEKVVIKETAEPEKESETKAPVTPSKPSRPSNPGTSASTPSSPSKPSTPATTETETESETETETETAAPAVPATAETEAKPTETETPVPETTGPDDGGERHGRDYWALLNLLCMLATIAICVVMLVLYFKKKEDDDDEEKAEEARENRETPANLPDTDGEEEDQEDKIYRGGLLRIIGIIPAIVAVILFVLTEDIRLPMWWWDEWTIWMIIILLIEIIIAFFARRRVRENDEENQEEEAS